MENMSSSPSLPSSKSSPSSKASSEQELYRLGHKKRQRVRNRELKKISRLRDIGSITALS